MTIPTNDLSVTASNLANHWTNCVIFNAIQALRILFNCKQLQEFLLNIRFQSKIVYQNQFNDRNNCEFHKTYIFCDVFPKWCSFNNCGRWSLINSNESSYLIVCSISLNLHNQDNVSSNINWFKKTKQKSGKSWLNSIRHLPIESMKPN